MAKRVKYRKTSKGASNKLYDDIIYSGAPIRKYFSQFYMDYAYLNQAGLPPSTAAIRNFQLSKLASYTQASLGGATQKALDLNYFLLSQGSFNSKNPNSVIEQSIDAIYNQIIPSIVGSGILRKSNQQNLTTQESTLLKIQLLERELQGLNNQLNLTDTIDSNRINLLHSLIKQVPGVTVQQVLDNFWGIQGDILEEIGVAWAEKNIPQNLNLQGVKTVNVGNINIGGTGAAGFDLAFFDLSKIITDNVQINYKLDSQSKTQSLKDFLDWLPKYNGNKQVIISNSQLAQLQQYILLKAQAKSGKNQLPWNKTSKNTQVGINDLDQSIMPVKALKHIYDLRVDTQNHPVWKAERDLKVQAQSYNALMNYGLATALNKVMHLSAQGNQLVLTRDGFMTYTQRIKQLFDSNPGKYIKVQGWVHMDNKLLSNKFIVTF